MERLGVAQRKESLLSTSVTESGEMFKGSNYTGEYLPFSYKDLIRFADLT